MEPIPYRLVPHPGDSEYTVLQDARGGTLALVLDADIGLDIARACNLFARMHDALASIRAVRDAVAELGHWPPPVHGTLPEGVPEIKPDQEFDDWAADVAEWALPCT